MCCQASGRECAMTLAVHLLNSRSTAGRGWHQQILAFRSSQHKCRKGLAGPQRFHSRGSSLCRSEIWDPRPHVSRQTSAVHPIVEASAHHTSTDSAHDHSPIVHPALRRETRDLSQKVCVNMISETLSISLPPRSATADC